MNKKYVVYIGIGILFFVCKLNTYAQQQSIPKIQPRAPTIEHIIRIIQNKQPKLDPTTTKEISKAILIYSKKFQFPPELIIAIIERESSFNPVAISKSDCVGLMQINPTAHPKKLDALNIKGTQIFNIDNNIHLGCLILYEYYNSTGTISEALKKYLGANNRAYLLDILTSFTDLMIMKK